MNSLPGPQVGNAESEQMILPPVAASASSAALRVGNNAGSGFLTSEKSLGICLNNDVIMDLQCYQHLLPAWAECTYLDS